MRDAASDRLREMCVFLDQQRVRLLRMDQRHSIGMRHEALDSGVLNINHTKQTDAQSLSDMASGWLMKRTRVADEADAWLIYMLTLISHLKSLVASPN